MLGVLKTGALVFGVYIRALYFWKLPYRVIESCHIIWAMVKTPHAQPRGPGIRTVYHPYITRLEGVLSMAHMIHNVMLCTCHIR